MDHTTCGHSYEPSSETDPTKLEGEWLLRPNATCGRYISRYRNICGCTQLYIDGTENSGTFRWNVTCPYEAGQLPPPGWHFLVGGWGPPRDEKSTIHYQYDFNPPLFERPCDIPQPDVVCVNGLCDGDTSRCNCSSIQWIGDLCDEPEVFSWLTSDWGSCDFLPYDGNNLPFNQDYQPHCGRLYQNRTAICVAQSTGDVVDDSWCLGTAVNDGSLQPAPSVELIQPCVTNTTPSTSTNHNNLIQQEDNNNDDEEEKEQYHPLYIPCQNNGQCNDITAQCHCPIGTRGVLCEEQYTPEYKWDYTEWSEECHNIYSTQKCGIQAQYRKARCYETYYNITIDDLTKCFESSGISDVLLNATACGEIVKGTSLSASQQQQSNVCGATAQYHGYCASYDDNGDEFIDFDATNQSYGIFDGIIKLINGYTLNPNTIDNYMNQNLTITTNIQEEHEDQMSSYDPSVDLLTLPYFDCSCQPGFYGEYCEIAQDVHWVVEDWSECQLQRNEFSASCGRPHRTRQVTCQIVDHDDTILSNQHPSCLAIASQMPVNIDFTSCHMDVSHTCQNGGACINKVIIEDGNNNNNNNLDIFAGDVSTPAHTLQPLECQCTPGWSGVLCDNVVNITHIQTQIDNSIINDEEETNQQQEQVEPKQWSISRWSECMLPNEYQMMLDNTTIPATPQGCDEYKRYRTVSCVVIVENKNKKNNKKTQTTTVVDDDECIAYYKYLELQQDRLAAKDNTYISVPILTTKPLQEESCFMYYPPCVQQEGQWIGTNLTNADHINGDDFVKDEKSSAFISSSSIYIMIIAMTFMLSFIF